MECVKEDVKEEKGFIVRDATVFMMMWYYRDPSCKNVCWC